MWGKFLKFGFIALQILHYIQVELCLGNYSTCFENNYFSSQFESSFDGSCFYHAFSWGPLGSQMAWHDR